jgi:hypothetical protein
MAFTYLTDMLHSATGTNMDKGAGVGMLSLQQGFVHT